MTIFDKYINIPFKHMGRYEKDKKVDCFGLVKVILENEANIKFGDYLENFKYDFDWCETQNHIIDNINNDWLVVNKPFKKFDILLFCTYHQSKIANHIGLYIGDNKFIHIEENQYSRIDRIEGFWSRKLYKVIRYKELN